MGVYLRPTDVESAVRALAGGDLVILAGGTDFYPARVGKPLDDNVLDVTALGGLDRIEDRGDAYRLGARVTWSDLLRAELPPWFAGLKLAAREIGGAQVQNAGTIVGNVCNASPAADGMPNLLALDASVDLASVKGRRVVPLAEFVLGNRKTARRSDELVTGLVIPKPRTAARATFLKLGARKYLVISIVMVAVVLETAADDTVAGARIAVGACSVVTKRLTELETAIRHKRLNGRLKDFVEPSHLAPLAPIDDVRGTSAYRLDTTFTLLRRALDRLVFEK